MYYKNDDREFHRNLASTPMSSGNTGTLPSFSDEYKSLLRIPNSAKNETVGATIKNNIKNVLSKKYSEPDTKHLFDGIDDDEIEKSIPVAESAIKTNIDRGFLKKDYTKNLPNLRDGLALSYAAINKGNNKAATRAREAAYTEAKNTDYSLAGNLNIKNEKNSLNLLNNFGNRVDKPEGVRFKAEADKVNNESKSTPKPEEFKSYIPKNSMTTGFQNQRIKQNNHQFNNVSDEQKKLYETAEKEGITMAHAQIKTYAEQWKDVPEYKWTMGDIAKWITTGGDEFLHQKKLGFIENYKDVIKDAAEKNDIPPFLLAGVAYVEFGGDPMWFDDVGHSVRSFDWSGPDWVDENLTITKNPDLTSFGNISIQVRRALETLGYDTTTDNRDSVILSLKNPIQNIYISAAHLNDLKSIDYKDKDAGDLTDDEIKIIASRYNIGPHFDKNDDESGYSKEIYANKQDILNSLS